MTRQDRPALPTRQPEDPGQALHAAAERNPSRTIRLAVVPWTSPLLHFAGFVAVYLIAVCTPFGQLTENAALKGFGTQAWIYDWTGSSFRSTMTLPPLNAAAMPTLIVGTTVIAAVALARRCWRHGCAAIGVVGGTLGGAEVLHHNLPRPDLVNAPHGLTEGSFPSGHVAIAAGLALGAALVVSPRIRPYIAAVGMLWLAFTAGAVQTLGWHRPSDTLGAALLACACYSLVARLLPPAPEQGITLRPRTLPTIALALSAAVALAASARVDSATTPLPFAAAAFLCAALLWFTAAERPTRRAMR